MSATIHITLEGLPERVQETADILDQAFPGLMTWKRFAEPGRDHAVRLEGRAGGRSTMFLRPLHRMQEDVALGKKRKYGFATGQAQQGAAFCASLSKSLGP